MHLIDGSFRNHTVARRHDHGPKVKEVPFGHGMRLESTPFKLSIYVCMHRCILVAIEHIGNERRTSSLS